MSRWLAALLFLAATTGGPACLEADPVVDETLPDYQKVSGISGNLSSVGSDTLANLMTLWAEKFRTFYPGVNIQIQAPGSSSAPTALIEGTSSLGPMSRLMKDTELEAFESRYGYKPTPIAVAIDALALFVHRDNPLQGLSLSELDAIFSVTRNCGEEQAITSWGQLGMTGAWQRRSIQLFGRNAVSGTYGYFKQYVLCNGDFRNSVNEQPGSASVVQSVSTSLNGIGYSSIGYATSSVRTIALAPQPGAPLVAATPQNAVAGRYPLARNLYVYVNKPPGRTLDPLTGQFLHLVLSRQGQLLVIKDGYIPLPADVAAGERSRLN